MQLSEDEKQKRLQALKDLLSDEEERDFEPEDKDDEGDEDKEDSEEMKEEGYQEHFSAIFEGTELSEEARDKLKLLFEAAVNYETDRKVSEIKAQLEEEMKAAIEAKEAELKDEADAYLSYVVE